MTYDYKCFFENKIKEIAKEDYIMDMGGAGAFQKGMLKYKSLFIGRKYQTLDRASEYNPNIVGDIQHLPIKNNKVNAIICNSVLEHLHSPHQAVNEIYRVLIKRGKFLGYTHFVYPYHARHNIYGDYYRFTEEALKYLFKRFEHIEIKKQGGIFRALMFFSPWQNKTRFIWEPMTYILDKLFKTERRTTTAGYYIYA